MDIDLSDLENNGVRNLAIAKILHGVLEFQQRAYEAALREQLVKIARRGRKRYLGLTFVTQSPNDLPDEVLRVVNIKSFVANADESLWTLVRGLGQGQSLTSFAHMRRPVITAMDPSPARLRMTE